MTPLVSNLWPQFMVDPAFAACFGQVIVEHAQMLRQERQVIFTLRSGAPLDKNLCARLLASLQPDYEGFELRIQNLFGYAMLDEAALRDLMEEMKRDGVPINGFLDRCKINIIGQKITIGVCHGTKFLQEMHCGPHRGNAAGNAAKRCKRSRAAPDGRKAGAQDRATGGQV